MGGFADSAFLQALFQFLREGVQAMLGVLKSGGKGGRMPAIQVVANWYEEFR